MLVVEDSEDDTELLLQELRRGNYEPTYERVETSDAMQEALVNQRWDLVIADYAMPQFSAPAALSVAQSTGLDLPFIILSGTIGEEMAVEAMKAGAHDYIMKGKLARLLPAIERELREATERRMRRRAEVASRQEAQISALLARTGQELIALLDRPALLDRLCQLTTEAVDCDCSHTVLWETGTQAFVPIAGHGDTPEQWEEMRVVQLPRPEIADLLTRLDHERVLEMTATGSRGSTLPDEAVHTEPSAAAANVASSTAALPSDHALLSVASRHGITSSLIIALRRGGQVIGFQTACYRDASKSFSSHQFRIASGIGQLASLALQNVRLVEELERASRLKSEFVSTVSHELRTPLNVIIGYNALLLEGAFGDLSSEQSEPVQRIDRNARELLELITATLDLGRIEAGQLHVELAEFSVADLIAEIDNETRDLQAKPGVIFTWKVADPLPTLHSDRAKLKVVLKNLIRNAVKFTDKGSIRVSAEPTDAGIEFCVTDTGVGIAREAQASIFEPFRQVDGSSTRRHGGVGLGLHIVCRLLSLLGGRITLESEIGAGSTFRVWTPRNVQCTEPQSHEKSQSVFV